jgi:PmbA protein
MIKPINRSSDLTPEEITLDLDEGLKIIKLAEKSGAHSVEVFIIKGVDSNFSIENDTVNFSSSSSEFGVGIRIIKDKHLGFGYCTNLSQTEVAIKNALNATKLTKKQDFDFPYSKKPQNFPSIYDKSILELPVKDGLEFSKILIESVKEVDNRVIVTGGGVGYGGGVVGIVNSNGLEIEYKGTGIFGGVSTLLRDKTVSTGFEYDYSRNNDIKLEKVGKLAAELAIKGQDPVKLEPGIYDVMFTPHALTELLEFSVIPGLYGEQANKGETAYSGKLGEEVVSNDISVIDDGILENGINTVPIDDEGTPSQRSVLVENGILKSYLFDALSAKEFNTDSTGNAVRAENLGSGKSYKAVPKTKATNFTIEGNNKQLDELMGDLKLAVNIHQLLGAHTANQASGDFSVNSPNLFLIENGEVTKACKQVMISGNMPKLMKQITGLGDDYKNVSGGLTPIASRLPSVVIEKVKII